MLYEISNSVLSMRGGGIGAGRKPYMFDKSNNPHLCQCHPKLAAKVLKKKYTRNKRTHFLTQRKTIPSDSYAKEKFLYHSRGVCPVSRVKVLEKAD